jgi:hypothetical protein
MIQGTPEVQVWAEGTDPTGGRLHDERSSNRHQRLQTFETGHEDVMSGGWVRCSSTSPGAEHGAVGLSPPSSRSSGPGSRRSPEGCWSRG